MTDERDVGAGRPVCVRFKAERSEQTHPQTGDPPRVQCLKLLLDATDREAAGDWGAASIDLSAGSADLSGSAESLFVNVSAGEARIDVAVSS